LKWDLGFSESRVKQIDAWSRLFALFAITLIAVTTLRRRQNSSLILFYEKCPDISHESLRSSPSSIDPSGIIAVPGGARVRRLVDIDDAGRRLVVWR
jgi:hypothetical protein